MFNTFVFNFLQFNGASSSSGVSNTPKLKAPIVFIKKTKPKMYARSPG